MRAALLSAQFCQPLTRMKYIFSLKPLSASNPIPTTAPATIPHHRVYFPYTPTTVSTCPTPSPLCLVATCTILPTPAPITNPICTPIPKDDEESAEDVNLLMKECELEHELEHLKQAHREPPPRTHTHLSLSQRRPKVAEVEPQGIPSCTPPPPCPHSYPLVQAAAEMKRLEAMQRTRGRGRRRRREPSPPTQWAQRVSSKSGSSNWRSPHSSGLPWPAGEGTRSRLDPQTGPRGGPKQTFSLTPGRLAQPEANWYQLQTNQYRFQAK